VKVVHEDTPLLPTYIQHVRPDQQLGFVTYSDLYMLGRVSFGDSFTDDLCAQNAWKKKGLFSGSGRFLDSVASASHMEYSLR
jgi:hypothetical protein